MSSATEPVISINNDLWSLIEKDRSTQAASLRVLQRFVLSLNEQQLKQVISSYLRERLSSCDLSGLPLKKRANAIFDKNEQNVTDVDQQILSKMNVAYGQKQNKKILRIIQQNQGENNHILSMNPEVLAYSFQYLSFRESCQLQNVCLYFVYLRRTYRGLSNYYIKLDKRFWCQMNKDKIRMDMLTQFKHVNVASFYQDDSKYDGSYYKTSIFDYVMQVIFIGSIHCLKTLEIDIPLKSFHSYSYSLTTLNFMLDLFQPLSITKLIWQKDGFHKIDHNATRDNVFEGIEKKLLTQFPNLKSYSFGIHDVGNFWSPVMDRYTKVDPIPHLSKHLLCVVHAYQHLAELDLFCPEWNVYKSEYGIIESIVKKLTNLQKLCITSQVHSLHDMNMCTHKIVNPSLQELNLEFIINIIDKSVGINCIQKIISYLFSSFINIHHFQFGFAFKSVAALDMFILDIDWSILFSLLMKQKLLYSLKNEPISELKCVRFDQITWMDALSVLNALKLIKDERFLHLIDFGINVVGASDITKFTEVNYQSFVNHNFIPFINVLPLQTLSLSYGYGYKKYVYRDWKSGWHEEYCRQIRMPVKSSYFDPIINILSKLPKSLISLQLKPPKYDIKSFKMGIVEKESMKLVNKLCDFITRPNDSDLQWITLNKVQLSKQAKDFLIFMFGFNNKLQLKYRRKCKEIEQYALTLK